MSAGYATGLVLDRKDNDGNYSPENCRFVTMTESNRHTRRIVHITAFGETKPLHTWSYDQRCVTSADTLRRRILAQGMSPEAAITTAPVRSRKKV